jgi:hypothetical protein
VTTITRREPDAARQTREADFLKLYLGGPPGVRYNGVKTVLALEWTTRYASAGVTAARLLKSPRVRAKIDQHAARAHSTAEKALARTALRAYADARDVLEWDEDGTVRLTPSATISDAGASLIAGLVQRVTVTTDPLGGTVESRRLEVKLHDGDGARRDLLKLHGLLVDRREISGPGGSPIAMDTRVVFYLPENGRTVTAPLERRAALPAANGNGRPAA